MSLQRNKSDKHLGEQVRQALVDAGLETPVIENYWQTLANEKKDARDTVRQEIEAAFSQIMTVLGLDLKDDSLQETPKRVAKMLLSETLWGLDWDNFPKSTVVDNKMKYDEMVVERNIRVLSMCEHHFLPIIGVAHVAYIPGDKVLGLSKLNRIVEFFSRRPQIQERLTAQIQLALREILGTNDVAVVIEAEHMCVKTRGVEDPCSDTVTSKLGGVFKTPTSKAEFMAIINRAKPV